MFYFIVKLKLCVLQDFHSTSALKLVKLSTKPYVLRRLIGQQPRARSVPRSDRGTPPRTRITVRPDSERVFRRTPGDRRKSRSSRRRAVKPFSYRGTLGGRVRWSATRSCARAHAEERRRTLRVLARAVGLHYPVGRSCDTTTSTSVSVARTAALPCVTLVVRQLRRRAAGRAPLFVRIFAIICPPRTAPYVRVHSRACDSHRSNT